VSDPDVSEARHPPPRSWLASLLTLAALGAGQLYAGRPLRGIGLHFAGYALAGAALALFTRGPAGPVAVVAPLLVIAVYFGLVAMDAWRSTRRPTRFSRRARWLSVAALVLFSATAGDRYATWLKAQAGEAFRITGANMEPTLVPGDYLYIAPQRVAELRRDQLLVWNDTTDSRLHRVVGLPGDTLQMLGTRLLRNGVVLEEPYTRYSEHVADAVATRTWGPLVVPRDSMFVLGDHRDNSFDSRYFGFVALNSVRGRPARIYFSRSAESGVRWSRIGALLDDGAPTA
jgi:signal peptidase I